MEGNVPIANVRETNPCAYIFCHVAKKSYLCKTNRMHIMKHKAFIFIMLVATGCWFASCHSWNDMAYLSDAKCDSASAIRHTYNTGIHVGDRLYIHVDSQAPASVLAFNQETNKILGKKSGVATARNTMQVEGYLVSEAGEIEFPLLGTLHVGGLTHDQLADTLQRQLQEKGFLNDPVVTVRLMNFRVAVLGEVKKPMEIHVEGQRLTILEALAKAGDVTIYGRRDMVSLVRDTMGGVMLVDLDLTKSDFLNTPYYYLQPNDIIYVDANKMRKKQARSAEAVEETKRITNIIRQTATIVSRSLQTIDQMN